MTSADDFLIHESLLIGSVDEVAPALISVSIDYDAPHGTSFTYGNLQRFPSVNGFVVLPCEAGAILALVLWLGISDIPQTTRQRDNRSDSVGLPHPRRRLKALPLGLIHKDTSGALKLERGTLIFPTVGDPVRLPTAAEARLAAPHTTAAGSIAIGSAPMAAHAPVTVSPNMLFGRHLAILGNTGSGKSCTLTHLLRQCAESVAPGVGSFRAVIIDLNGEYSSAFEQLGSGIPIRRFSVETTEASGTDVLRVPYWLWSYREWAAFTVARAGSQAPVLRQALHLLRTSARGGVPAGIATIIAGRRMVRQFQGEQVGPKEIPSYLSGLDRVMKSCAAVSVSAGTTVTDTLRGLHAALDKVLKHRRGSGEYPWKMGVSAPTVNELRSLTDAFDNALTSVGIPDLVGDVSSVDTPTPFDARNLIELIGAIAVDAGPDVAGWVAPMQDRLAVAMSDRRMATVCGHNDGESLKTWIDGLLGESDRGQISVLDLSLVPSSAQHVIASVLARLLLETLERHRRLGHQLPVILAVEEAHALIRRRTDPVGDEASTAVADLCRESFERIGREGRKFGLSLIVSSQRPSELSETVLSQCNTYIIHRIVNARDQDLIRRLVPDALGNLLNEVSAYPARHALLLGMATEVPVLVEIDELHEHFRPHAADPDFERAWSGGSPLHTDELSANWLPEQLATGVPLTTSEDEILDDIPNNDDDDLEDEPPF